MRRTVREGWKRGGRKACGGVKMGCIMTPMPNHLSTYRSLPLNHKTTQNSVGGKKNGVGMKKCGDHTSKDVVRKRKRAVWKPHHTRNIEQHHRIKEEEMELDHIALIVSKEENLAFYEKLGFKEKNRIERGYDTVVFMENGALLLEVFIDPNHPARVTNPEARGLRHFCLVVEDLDEVVKSVECEEIRTDWFGRRFTFTKDPDGQPIELKEKKCGGPHE